MIASSRVRRLIGVLMLLALAWMLFATTGRRKMRDFEVYWTAGGRAAAAAPLYRADDGHYQFKYLPGFAVAIAPLAHLSLDAAKVTWITLSVLCLALLVSLSVKIAEPSALGARAVGVLTVVAMAKFFAHELVLGQANLLFAAVCVSGLTLLLRSREGIAGACFGGATLIKPYAILFVPYLLLTRRWLAAAVASGAGLVVLCIPIPLYGMTGTLELMRDWWSTATETSVPLLTNADSISIYAMYAKWMGWSTVAAVLSIGTIGVLSMAMLAVLLRRRGIRAPETLEVGLVLTLIPLITPQGWDYVLLLSTPLVALLFARAREMARGDRIAFTVAIAVVAFSLYDVMGRALYARFMELAIITVCYLLIVLVAVRTRFARVT